MASKSSTKRVDTLCWKCENAVNGRKCPWARDFTPVEGWEAEPDLVWYNTPLVGGMVKHEQPSYIVKSCPLFEPDHNDRVKIPNDDIAKEIACETILRGVKDYNVMKKRGSTPDMKESTGEVVYLEDILKFFRSKWMDILTYGVLSTHSPDDVRRELGIDKEETNEAASR